MTDPMHALFDRLDGWRHLPAYQLERRANILFSLHLADVVGEKLGVAMDARSIARGVDRAEDRRAVA